MKTSNRITIIFITAAILLSGCSSGITKEAVEKELVSFIVDFIVQQEIGGPANYIQTNDRFWIDAPSSVNIIVWLPPVKNAEENSTEYLKSDEPIKVWLYADNKLVETIDKKETIQKFKQTYIINPESDTWAWGYYEFGIMSMSNNNQEAAIYVSVSCGNVCGHGAMYTLKRNNSGKWEIKESQGLWVS